MYCLLHYMKFHCIAVKRLSDKIVLLVLSKLRDIILNAGTL